jgi:hypothetical protein
VLHLKELVLALELAKPLQFAHSGHVNGRRLASEHAIAHLLAPLGQHERVDAQRLCDIFDQHARDVAHLNGLQLECLNASP